MKSTNLGARSHRAALAAIAVLGFAVEAEAGHKAVFTSTNSVDGNAVVMYTRHKGELTFAGEFATGGVGTGAALNSQGAVTMTNNGQWLLVVNAGSDDVTLFRVTDDSLEMTDIEPSGGSMPVSVTVLYGVVYVLNAGDDPNITGFTIVDGDLVPLPDSTRGLSGEADPGPAQVGFNHNGSALVVTERNTNLIDIYLVGEDGLLGDAIVHDSIGMTPFGFDFSTNGRLIVSEAFTGEVDSSAVSSYDIEHDGDLRVISASAPTTETAACWLVVTNGNKFAYTTNTGSDSITGYKVKPSSGQLIPLNSDGVTATTGEGSGPTDLALNRGGKFLFALNSGTGEIDAFALAPSSGALMPLGSVNGLPDTVTGLAAR